MSTTFEIGICQTQALTDYCMNQYGDKYRARDRAQTFIEGAFDHDGNQHAVDVDPIDKSPTTKTQDCSKYNSFQDEYPCDPSGTVTYDNLMVDQLSGLWYDQKK